MRPLKLDEDETSSDALAPKSGAVQEIHDIAKTQLETVRRLQGHSQTDMLRKVNDALTKSLNNANELVTMIDHFKSVSLSIVERQPPKGTLLQDLATQVLRGMQYTFPLRKITVLKIIPNNLSPVVVPAEHLEIILFHLLYYARQEIGVNVGIISIEAAERVKKKEDGSRTKYHDIRLSYSSPDMELKNIDRLFDPFYEGEEQEKSGRFGLFVAKKLIEHHGGMIDFKALPKNITFAVEFPA